MRNTSFEFRKYMQDRMGRPYANVVPNPRSRYRRSNSNKKNNNQIVSSGVDSSSSTNNNTTTTTANNRHIVGHAYEPGTGNNRREPYPADFFPPGSTPTSYDERVEEKAVVMHVWHLGMEKDYVAKRRLGKKDTEEIENRE